MPRLRYTRVEDALARIERDQPATIAFDTETTGVEFYDDVFAGTLSWRAPDGSLQNTYFPLEGPAREGAIQALGDILRGAERVIAHNLKFDAQKAILTGILSWEDIELIELHDTQTLYALLDENGRKGLKHLAVTVLNHDDTIKVPYKTKGREGEFRLVPREKYELDEARRMYGLRKEDGYHLLPRRVVVPYAKRDTDFTLRLYEALMPRLERKNDPGLLKLYASAMQLKRVLLRMEADGMRVDVPYLEAKASEYGVKVMQGWSRVVELTGSPDLNPQSPAQLMAVFQARGLTLESTDAATLGKLDDELAKAILQYREDKKMHTTYLVGLLHAQRDGVVHPQFNDDGARTGRMSSGSAKE